MASNVVRLPTARSRKVQQPVVGLEMARLSDQLPQHPATWEDHGGNKAWAEARFDRSPEMLILTAMFKLMPDTAKEEIRRRLASMADMNMAIHALTALAIVEAVK